MASRNDHYTLDINDISWESQTTVLLRTSTGHGGHLSVVPHLGKGGYRS
jgi:hypothetical protein